MLLIETRFVEFALLLAQLRTFSAPALRLAFPLTECELKKRAIQNAAPNMLINSVLLGTKGVLDISSFYTAFILAGCGPCGIPQYWRFQGLRDDLCGVGCSVCFSGCLEKSKGYEDGPPHVS